MKINFKYNEKSELNDEQEDIVSKFKEDVFNLYRSITGNEDLNLEYDDEHFMDFTSKILDSVPEEDRTDEYKKLCEMNTKFDSNIRKSSIECAAVYVLQDFINIYKSLTGIYDEGYIYKNIDSIFNSFKLFLTYTHDHCEGLFPNVSNVQNVCFAALDKINKKEYSVDTEE